MPEPSYASGYAIKTDLDTGVVKETYTITCCHCDETIHCTKGSGVKRGFCQNCMGPKCGRTRCQPCAPFEKQMEAFERILRRKIALDAEKRRFFAEIGLIGSS